MDALSLENIMYRHGLLELAFDDIASLALDGESAFNLLTKDFYLSTMCEAERQVIKAALPSKTALKQLLSGMFSYNDGLGDQCLMQGWIMTIEERHNRALGPALYGVNLSEKARSHALELEHSLLTLFTRQTIHSFPQRPISATAKIFGSKPCLLPDNYALQGPNEEAFLLAVKAASTNNTCKQNLLVAKLDEKALTYYVAITRLAQTQAELSGDPFALLRYRLKEQRENEKRVTRKLRATLEQQMNELKLKLDPSLNPKIFLETLDREDLKVLPKQQKFISLLKNACEIASDLNQKSGPERQLILLNQPPLLREAILKFLCPHQNTLKVSENTALYKNEDYIPTLLQELLTKCVNQKFTIEYNMIMRCLNGSPLVLPKTLGHKYLGKRLGIMLKALNLLKDGGFEIYEDENSLRHAYSSER